MTELAEIIREARHLRLARRREPAAKGGGREIWRCEEHRGQWADYAARAEGAAHGSHD